MRLDALIFAIAAFGSKLGVVISGAPPLHCCIFIAVFFMPIILPGSWLDRVNDTTRWDLVADEAGAARSREIIAKWGPARFADGFTKAVKTARQAKLKTASWMDRGLLRALVRR